MEKITKGSGFFRQWSNFSAELSEKEIPELATPKYIFRLNLTERIASWYWSAVVETSSSTVGNSTEEKGELP